jgi:hypothetical protein
MIALFCAFRATFLFACFAVGFVIGAGGALVRHAFFPKEVKIHYCYPHSTEEICRRAPDPALASPNQRVAARGDE